MATSIRNYETLSIRLAKEDAATRGFKGEQGGWIHSNGTGKAVCQGWSAYYRMNQDLILDEVTRSFSAFKTFRELVDAKGGYRPTMHLTEDWRLIHLALAYNRWQAERCDPRRVYVGSAPVDLPLWMRKELGC